MFNLYRKQFFKQYNKSRNHFIANPQKLIELEKWLMAFMFQILQENIEQIQADYNEANYLNPFWQNYPPLDRGRAPRGDQYPWIEVGEHAIGNNLLIFLAKKYKIREVALPAGPDQRFLLSSPVIKKITNITDTAMIFVDIKSVGPRDDFEHTVLSPYQVSGDGVWNTISLGVKNTPMIAKGKTATHQFYCALSPLYITSYGKIAPTISLFLKPRYDMLSITSQTEPRLGQPLQKITLICVPNGLLLTQNPNYLYDYPDLFFPGKDDKSKNKLKIRARVSFNILKQIDSWRVNSILVRTGNRKEI